MELLSEACIFILLLYGVFLCYLLFRLFLSDSGSKTEPEKDLRPVPGVSVVIPFRNEAQNLAGLLNSLESQVFKGTFEVILVNDESTDDYNKAMSSNARRIPIKIIQSVFRDNRGLTSKQQALDAGVKASTYDLIAFTDADMQLEPEWLGSLVKPACAGADLVFGHTVISSDNKSSFFTWFQKFQLETLFSVAYTFDRADLSGSCMGNNMLISRKAYLETGGFDAMGYSIAEDLHLLTTFKRKKFRTTAVRPFPATAVTFPAATLGDYLQQLLRWSRGGFRKNLTLLSAGTLLGVQNILLVLALLGKLPDPVSMLTFGNLLFTWFFTAVAFRRIRSKENPLLFLPFYAIFLLESVALILLSVVNQPVTWKNRRIE